MKSHINKLDKLTRQSLIHDQLEFIKQQAFEHELTIETVKNLLA